MFEPVVINFFELHFARRPIDIVLVRRITRPVARRREDLADQQAIGGKVRRHDVDDLARGVAAAANLEAAVLGRMTRGLQIALPRRRAAIGQLRRLRRRRRETRSAAADRWRAGSRRTRSRRGPERLDPAVDGDAALAGEQDEAAFVGAGVAGPRLARRNRAARRSARTASRRARGSPRSQCPCDARRGGDDRIQHASRQRARYYHPPMIRVANAPCSWGILEFAGSAAAAPATPPCSTRFATPATPAPSSATGASCRPIRARLASELAARAAAAGRRVRAGGVRGCNPPMTPASPRRYAPRALMRDAGAADAFIVLSDDNASVPEREQHAGRIRAEHGLPEAGLGDVCRRRRSGRARGAGRRPACARVFHPHCGGYVETPDEIDAADAPDRSRAARPVLDTGHILYGGGDPLEVFERARAIACGTCTSRTAIRRSPTAARAQGLGYLAAVRSQLFCELGTGAVDFRGDHARAARPRRTTAGSSSNRMCFPATARRSRAHRRAGSTCAALGL